MLRQEYEIKLRNALEDFEELKSALEEAAKMTQARNERNFQRQL